MWNVRPVKDVFDCQRIVSFEGIVFLIQLFKNIQLFLSTMGPVKFNLLKK